MLLKLGVDINTFQGYDEEIQGLPGKYAEGVGGTLWLLTIESQPGGGPVDKDGMPGKPAACIAFKDIGDNTCEMKRLFVSPSFRRRGLAKQLAEALMLEARRAGYRRMLLDTLVRLPAAVALYEGLGFKRVPPYVHNPMEDALYFGRDLPTPPASPSAAAGGDRAGAIDVPAAAARGAGEAM